MHRNPARPLSPHLTIWKWGPHMLASIIHRMTGVGLAFGAAALTWWLMAAASGAEAYESFTGWATHPVGIAIAVGLSWAFFQHLLTGLRHFVMDMGAGFELSTNKLWANVTMVAALLLTAAFWAFLIWVK
jgi:succinate dehydrogenase / fumarate reductase cytochrome b subunit